jgi:hypothetical protein
VQTVLALSLALTTVVVVVAMMRMPARTMMSVVVAI